MNRFYRLLTCLLVFMGLTLIFAGTVLSGELAVSETALPIQNKSSTNALNCDLGPLIGTPLKQDPDQPLHKSWLNTSGPINKDGYIDNQIIIASTSSATRAGIISIVNSYSLTLGVAISPAIPIHSNSEGITFQNPFEKSETITLSLHQITKKDDASVLTAVNAFNVIARLLFPKALFPVAEPNYAINRSILKGDPGSSSEIGGNPEDQPPKLITVTNTSDAFNHQWSFGGFGLNSLQSATGKDVTIAIFDSSPYSTGQHIIHSEATQPFTMCISALLKDKVRHVNDIVQSNQPQKSYLTSTVSISSSHGLFVAGLAHHIAPQSNIHLIEILDHKLEGSLINLLHAMHLFFQAQEQASNGSPGNTVVNLSLGLQLDPEDINKSDLKERQCAFTNLWTHLYDLNNFLVDKNTLPNLVNFPPGLEPLYDYEDLLWNMATLLWGNDFDPSDINYEELLSYIATLLQDNNEVEAICPQITLPREMPFPSVSLPLMLAAHTRNVDNRVIVAAAGNDGFNELVAKVDHRRSKRQQAPAQYPAVIGVGAHNHALDLPCFTNYGDVFAPGGNATWNKLPGTNKWRCKIRPTDGIVSLIETRNVHRPMNPISPWTDHIFTPTTAIRPIQFIQPVNPTYAYWSGTSFAAPLVSGLAALALDKLDDDLNELSGPPMRYDSVWQRYVLEQPLYAVVWESTPPQFINRQVQKAIGWHTAPDCWPASKPNHKITDVTRILSNECLRRPRGLLGYVSFDGWLATDFQARRMLLKSAPWVIEFRKFNGKIEFRQMTMDGLPLIGWLGPGKSCQDLFKDQTLIIKVPSEDEALNRIARFLQLQLWQECQLAVDINPEYFYFGSAPVMRLSRE
ncbi:S8 family serine peptidase [Chloroflexi bacterium TSY]|nr:S8 family serine peptidase [Chloroflexi bacterium TSY]